MRISIAIALAAVAAGIAPAWADIPVNDAAQLTQKSETAGTTIKLVPVMTQRQTANSGVKCAVTTGKKASVSDPTVKPQAGAGSTALHSYAPDLPASPDASAQGGTLNRQSLFTSSGDVASGLDASRQTLGAAKTAFGAASQQVGTATTVMAAIDMNSAARLQSGLAWNSAMGSANLWVTALNALNLALNSDMSRAATGMRAATTGTTTPRSGQACSVGMTGLGTPASPCRASTACSTTPPGSPVDPACVTARYVDTDGNVIFYLSQAQTQTSSAANDPLTATDLAAALASIAANSRKGD